MHSVTVQDREKWIAPSRGGYSGSTTIKTSSIKKRTPPKNPASSTPSRCPNDRNIKK